ncbi:hypothetical protein GRI58_10045 [Porphyrobacter algicida]|uniref:DUF937 domain-containing protein n=1 Tax=Qipengyuania algicida TaxID=1836209 RepID=A0A845AJT0_9SPHN|nr:hypothetical protein [Qipengyuania algicida]MXP29161.1 hypothetical protein [Qipengyuania algicida]
MSLFDRLLNAAHDHPTLTNMADKLGIDPKQAEQAIAALGAAHHEDGDTVQLAASKTGLDAGVLQQVVEQIGGEGSLTKFIQILDSDHDGNPFDDIAGFASGLFGKK